jgi:hypothetical protein
MTSGGAADEEPDTEMVATVAQKYGAELLI